MITVFVFLLSGLAFAQTPVEGEKPKISLSVPAGAPLRLYLTQKIPKRAGAAVEAKLLEPAFAFDKEVIPAGALAQGVVSRVQPVTKGQRVRAILNGDFTPLRQAQVEFKALVLPDGRKMALHTMETPGLNSIYTEPSAKKKKKRGKPQPQDQNGGILGTAKQSAKDRIQGEINAKTQGISDLVRGPNKKEKVVDMFWAKLPYHPQYVRRGTRFDAPLREPLEFGSESIQPADMAELGSQPHPDSVIRVRLLTALDSASTKTGQAVEAVTAAPLFSPSHKLIYPEGTRLTGTVVVAKKARSFHRAGQLRFNFQKVDLPEQAANLRPAEAAPAPMKTQAILEGAESSGKAPVKVDSEGGVKAQESKTRFLAPIISAVLAAKSADNERHHNDHDADDVNGVGRANSNVGGRTLGGGLGLGLLGAGISQSSKYVGMAFGYYGLGWSVYTNVIARGSEVQFDKNAMMDIKFGVRKPAPGSKFRAGEVTAGE
jgi:hypothetical protein